MREKHGSFAETVRLIRQANRAIIPLVSAISNSMRCRQLFNSIQKTYNEQTQIAYYNGTIVQEVTDLEIATKLLTLSRTQVVTGGKQNFNAIQISELVV